MQKVIIIGCPGSGKSTFARELQKATGLPLYYLDMMYWNEDKTTVEKEIFLERLKAAMENEKWIIDGNYSATMEMRFEACDTAFFLDYSVEICLDGIAKRQGKKRPDMPWIENEADEEFVEFIKKYNTDSRPKVMHLIEKYPDKNVVVFVDRKQSEEFLEKLNNA